ncbi:MULTISPECIES: DUF397 domain-containing protein [Nocardiopsis]|jgi:hypothetical protein|uniref:DUF397 domain-containing protein n=1 Tax=Nocardiopsis TaxID=2013 RepID=UPI0009DC3297|nr:DUF397 domain-containing protein [Nocardiopsis sp. CNS-639]
MTAEWHKSSYSSGNNECVEVREHESGADVRDTAHREAGHITVPLNQWVALIAQARGTH